MAAFRAASATPAVQATIAEAAPFVGDWALALEGPNGPAAFELTIKTEKDKVVAEIAGAGMAAQPIATIALVAKTLQLSYNFNYEGNAIDAVVSLTPAADGNVAAQIDFAGGAYTMIGAAAKKEKAK
jgi:hypothetical protein